MRPPYRPARPLVEGEDYTVDPNGLLVFTEKYHRERGYCCGSGCRHCPYDHEKVPAWKRPKKPEGQG